MSVFKSLFNTLGIRNLIILQKEVRRPSQTTEITLCHKVRESRVSLILALGLTSKVFFKNLV